MTVIVWDHRAGLLGADKQSTQSDLVRRVTKIRRIRDHLCAIAGDWDLGQEMFKWFEDGANPAEAPPCMRNKDDWVAFLAITPDKRVLKYERGPLPMDFTEAAVNDGWYVFGSGRDFAVGALAAGADIHTALKITSRYCVNCGMGYDVFSIQDYPLDKD